MNEVYVVAGTRRRLHRATRAEAGLLSHEADNLDSAKPRELYADQEVARRNARAFCKRCYPFMEGAPMTDEQVTETEETAEEAGLEPDLEDAPADDSGMGDLEEGEGG